jgi:ribonuclease G
MRIKSENNISNVYIELGEHYKMEITSDLEGFIQDINGEGFNVYVKYVKNINSFKVEPLLFQSQIDELVNCKINV